MRSSSAFLSGIGVRCIGMVPWLLQQSENFRRSDFLTPIPSAPEANDSFSHRHVNGRERDIPFDLPNRIAFVGGDEDDRAIARRRRDFVQGCREMSRGT